MRRSGSPVPERNDVDMALAEDKTIALVLGDDRPGREGERIHRPEKSVDFAVPVLVGELDASLYCRGDRVAVADDEVAFPVVAPNSVTVTSYRFVATKRRSNRGGVLI